jgi:glycosyltransferase involved in cell wall biosynthesis
VGGSDESDENYVEKLRRLADERILFTAYVPDFSKQLSAIDLVVAPSENEGFSLVVAEAMAAGIAVIATRAGGLAELVRNARTGMLVPVDDLDALCDAMRSLLKDDELRSRLGTAARAEASARFDREKVIDEIEKLYLTKK